MGRSKDRRTSHTPSHMAGSSGRHSSSSKSRSSRKSSGRTESKKTGNRSSSASSRQQANRPRREPLNDNYYYEQPRGSRGRYDRGGFEDISSYSSQKKKKSDKKQWEKSNRPKKKKRIGLVVFIFFLIIALALGAAYWYMNYLLDGLTVTDITRNTEELGIQSEALSDTSVKNIALFGLDARENENSGRSDALIVLTVDNKHDKIKMTSILRDSEVYIDGHGYDKITHAYVYGGPELAIKTLNQNFNLDISDYITVNFIEMAQIVDAFGGITVEISYDEMVEINKNLSMQEWESYDANIVQSDYMYNYGEVHLNGNQAVAYARIRSLDSDDMRANRQQTVLKALLVQATQLGALEYPDMIRTVMPLCETSMGFADITAAAPILFTDYATETYTIPSADEEAYGAYTDSGSWVYRYDLEAASRHLSYIIYEEDSPYYSEYAPAESSEAVYE